MRSHIVSIQTTTKLKQLRRDHRRQALQDRSRCGIHEVANKPICRRPLLGPSGGVQPGPLHAWDVWHQFVSSRRILESQHLVLDLHATYPLRMHPSDEQVGFTSNPDTPMSSIRCWTDYVSNGQLIEFALELDFTNARCTSASTGKGESCLASRCQTALHHQPSTQTDHSSFYNYNTGITLPASGTIIAISDIYRKYPNNLPNTTITITATKVGGE